jgi:hypothetical protein
MAGKLSFSPAASRPESQNGGRGQKLCTSGSLSDTLLVGVEFNPLFQESIMTATHDVQSTSKGPRLHLALELSWDQWKLAFTIGHGQPPRLRCIRARDLPALVREIAKAKRRFGLADEAAVVSCYEAGRDGFWLHRWLTSQGIANVIVDSASIEVNRRKRRAKSDRLDAAKLVRMLLRYHAGETKVWSVVRVPEAADEDRRHLHRELIAVQDERTEHVNRIKGFLAGQGIALARVRATFPEELTHLRCWDGSELGADLRQRLLREFARWQLADAQVKELENERKQRIRRDDTPHAARRQGAWPVGARGDWAVGFVVAGVRAVCLAAVCQSPAGGRHRGPDADAVPVGKRSSGARDQQGGQQGAAADDGGTGLGLAALAARQRTEPLV